MILIHCTGAFGINRWVYFGINGDIKREDIPRLNTTTNNIIDQQKVGNDDVTQAIQNLENGSDETAKARSFGHFHYRKSKYRNLIVNDTYTDPEDFMINQGNKRFLKNSSHYDIDDSVQKPGLGKDFVNKGNRGKIENNKLGQPVQDIRKPNQNELVQSVQEKTNSAANMNKRKMDDTKAELENILKKKVTEVEKKQIKEKNIIKRPIKKSNYAKSRKVTSNHLPPTRVIDVSKYSNDDDDEDDDNDDNIPHVISHRKKSGNLSPKEELLYHNYVHHRNKEQQENFVDLNTRDRRTKIPRPEDDLKLEFKRGLSLQKRKRSSTKKSNVPAKELTEIGKNNPKTSKWKYLTFYLIIYIRRDILTILRYTLLQIYVIHPKVFYEKGVLKNFVKLSENHLCQSLFFNKVAVSRPATLFKKRLQHICFPVNFVKFLKTPMLQNTCELTVFLRAVENISSSQLTIHYSQQ